MHPDPAVTPSNLSATTAMPATATAAGGGVVAVHPTGRSTAIVRRAATQLSGWSLLANDHGTDPLAHATAVRDQLTELAEDDDRVALVTLPSRAQTVGHGVSYRHLLRAMLLGALSADPRTPLVPLLVDPAAYGAWHVSGYPGELVGSREQRGAGRLRPCRAAWDLAGAALPDGPGTLTADRAHGRELVTATVRPVTDWRVMRAWLRLDCRLCGDHDEGRYLRNDQDDQDPTRAAASYQAEHIDWHLVLSGRAGCRLVNSSTATDAEGVGS
jgi:hypothetical protein